MNDKYLDYKNCKILKESISLTSNSTGVIYSEKYDQLYIEYTKNDSTARYFISHEANVPQGLVYYDYFNTGEMYYNFSNSLPINGTSQGINTMHKVFNTEYFKNANKDYISIADLIVKAFGISKAPNNQIPTEESTIDGMVYYSVSLNQKDIEQQKESGNSKLGYYFPASYIFHFADEHIEEAQTAEQSSVVPVPEPLCSNFTYVSSNNKLNVVAENYNFANTFKDTSICTSEEILEATKKDIYYCPYFNTSAYSACSYYKPNVNVIKVQKVSSEYSSDNHQVELQHYVTSEGSDVFRIVNQENSVLYKVYNPDKNYDELLALAEEMFQDYATHYTTSLSEEVEQVNITQATKVPYISSLVDA
jgi:hypothetical protein